MQTVASTIALTRPGSEIYVSLAEQVLKFRADRYDGAPPPHGAIWLTIYPNIMVEWYPHVLVVSPPDPARPQSTTNVVEF